MKKSAFTLIELLVVIAIIAILAGIALPVFGKVLERGKATGCANNLHQLGIGTIAYLADNDDQIFSDMTPGGWPSILYSKYAPNWKSFKCPFDKRPDGANVAAGTGVPISYGINKNILTQPGGATGFDGNVTKYTFPSQLIYMAPNVDTSQVANLTFVAGTGDTNVSLAVPTDNTKKLGTHTNRSQINALYADAHVASITYRDFATTIGNDGRARWEPTFPGQ